MTIIAGTITPTTPHRALYIATDGSARPSNSRRTEMLGCGWIATDGAWGLAAEPLPVEKAGTAASIVAELYAVWHAIHRRTPGRGITLLLDSTSAIAYLDCWAAGEMRMPPGYTAVTLRQLAAHIHRYRGGIAWSHQRGHAGHLLNEAADSLAKIGREWASGHCTGVAARTRGERLVEGFLADPRLREVA